MTRQLLLLNVALPVAWLVIRVLRVLEPGHKGLMCSVVGRGASLKDTLADARWWLQRLDEGAAR